MPADGRLQAETQHFGKTGCGVQPDPQVALNRGGFQRVQLGSSGFRWHSGAVAELQGLI